MRLILKLSDVEIVPEIQEIHYREFRLIGNTFSKLPIRRIFPCCLLDRIPIIKLYQLRLLNISNWHAYESRTFKVDIYFISIIFQPKFKNISTFHQNKSHKHCVTHGHY